MFTFFVFIVYILHLTYIWRRFSRLTPHVDFFCVCVCMCVCVNVISSRPDVISNQSQTRLQRRKRNRMFLHRCMKRKRKPLSPARHLRWKRTYQRSDTAEESNWRCFGPIYCNASDDVLPFSQIIEVQSSSHRELPAPKWQSESLRRSLHRQKPGSATAKCTGYFWQNGVSIFCYNFTPVTASLMLTKFNLATCWIQWSTLDL